MGDKAAARECAMRAGVPVTPGSSQPIDHLAKEIIEQLRKDGVTVFLVEQNANQALKIADRAYVLENGRLRALWLHPERLPTL